MVTKRNDTRPIAELRPYVGNARTHSDAQVAQLEGSMLEFGWTIPVLIDEDGSMIAGHGRVLAAERIYGAGKAIRGLDGNWLPDGHAPVLVAKGWPDQRKRAYVIADNQLAANAGWDDDLLRSEIEALSADDFDLSLLGFDDVELTALTMERASGENDPAAEWTGMPEFEQRDKTAFRSLAIHFHDQAGVDAFAELVGQKITPNTRMLWFPEIEIETYADKRYADEDAA